VNASRPPAEAPTPTTRGRELRPSRFPAAGRAPAAAEMDFTAAVEVFRAGAVRRLRRGESDARPESVTSPRRPLPLFFATRHHYLSRRDERASSLDRARPTQHAAYHAVATPNGAGGGRVSGNGIGFVPYSSRRHSPEMALGSFGICGGASARKWDWVRSLLFPGAGTSRPQCAGWPSENSRCGNENMLPVYRVHRGPLRGTAKQFVPIRELAVNGNLAARRSMAIPGGKCGKPRVPHAGCTARHPTAISRLRDLRADP